MRSTGQPSAWIAVTGLTLVLFLIVHFAGVALAPLAPQTFTAYAAALHRQPWLLPAELLLAAAGLAHPILSLLQARRDQQARGARPLLLVSRRGDLLASLAAGSTALSGALLLLFLGLHLAQLRLPRPAPGQELAQLQASLASPAVLLLYLAASLALGLHLHHGTEAAHRRLGLLDADNAGRIRTWGRGLALLLAGGFALVPLLLAWP